MKRITLTMLLVLGELIMSGCTLQPRDAQASSDNRAEATVTSIVEKFPQDHPEDCPVTRPPDPPFTPPEPYVSKGPFENEFWYGSNTLWTALPTTGAWFGLPHNPEGYTQKVFWWREGYVWTEEPEPELTVIGGRLDASAPPLNVSRATNAYANDIGSAMLVGVDFPTPGCWKITGSYHGAQLSFVIWIAP